MYNGGRYRFDIQNIIKKQFLIYIYNQKIVKIFFFCFEYVNVL